MTRRYNLLSSHHLPHSDGVAYPLPVRLHAQKLPRPNVVAVAPIVIYGGIYHEVSIIVQVLLRKRHQIEMWSDWGSHRPWTSSKRSRPPAWLPQGTLARFNLHVGQQSNAVGNVYPFNVTVIWSGTIDKGPSKLRDSSGHDSLRTAAGNPWNRALNFGWGGRFKGGS